MGPRALASLALSAGVVGSAGPAAAFDASLYTRHRFFGELLSDEVILTQPRYARVDDRPTGRQQELAYQLQVVARIAGRPADWLGLEVGIDSGVLSFGRGGTLADGLPIGARLTETLLLGETFAELQLGEAGLFQLRAGKLIAEVGDGVLLHGYALGVELDVDPSYADPEISTFGRLRILLPDATFTASGKKSPLMELEVGQRLGDDATVALFGALFFDGGDDLGPVIRRALFQGALGRNCALLRRRFQLANIDCSGEGVDVDTNGVLGWAGARVRWRSERAELRGTVMLGLGTIDATITLPGEMARAFNGNITMTSGLGSVEGSWRPIDALTVTGFGVAATGDGGLEALASRASYSGFLALTPRLPLTMIFFGGGLSTTLQSLTVSSVSPGGSGLLATGIGVEATPWGEGLSLGLSGAVMAATHPSTTGSLYGGEIDAEVVGRVLDELELFAQGGVFLPGGYYADRRAGVQVIMGVALALGD